MTNNEVEILRRARKLIEIGWTRNANARNNRNAEVSVNDPTATCFCLYGAILRASTNLPVASPSAMTHDLIRQLRQFLPADLGAFGVIQWNDTCTTKKPVLDLIDRALEGMPT